MGGRIASLVLFVCCAHLGCDTDSGGPDGDINKYYDLKELVRQQVVLLDNMGTTVIKVAEINGTSERVSFEPDSTTWAEELDPLAGLDLNEPHLWDLYDVEEGQPGMLEYRSRDPDETRVDVLRIRMLKNTHIIESVSATIADTNPLFSMRREIRFDFSRLDSGNILTSYSIAGWQKMILLDTNSIRVDCKVELRSE